eukprot:gb/GECG01007496.1/.p1 GENE.gb/GECG01007496.1/~~gb/GECG01007496.1/.p1  ORF type:complete len:2327 (+),score=325.61 gb/GECG01007496.1/:1-6981(+)
MNSDKGDRAQQRSSNKPALSIRPPSSTPTPASSASTTGQSEGAEGVEGSAAAGTEREHTSDTRENGDAETDGASTASSTPSVGNGNGSRDQCIVPLGASEAESDTEGGVDRTEGLFQQESNEARDQHQQQGNNGAGISGAVQNASASRSHMAQFQSSQEESVPQLYLGDGSTLGTDFGSDTPFETNDEPMADGMYMANGESLGYESEGGSSRSGSRSESPQGYTLNKSIEKPSMVKQNWAETKAMSGMRKQENVRKSSDFPTLPTGEVQDDSTVHNLRDSMYQSQDDKRASQKMNEEDEAEEIPVTLLRGHSFLRQQLSSSDFSHYENREEFMHVDYTPAINLRPVDLHTPLRTIRTGRTIKLNVCITMYNEDADELSRTLRGIAGNLTHLEAIGIPWTDVLVCIVVDGRHKMNNFTKEYLKEMHAYDEDLIITRHKDCDVTCHIFEKTVELKKDANQREYFPPMQLLVGVKEKNGGKLNSHLWFFSGFSKQLQPKYCLLVDVGTWPKPKSIMYLVKAMEDNPQLGGVTGEIEATDASKTNILEAAQYFEYRAGHILDKPMESSFGFISVLPGAFSAFRWKAIRGEPLSEYFKLEENNPSKLGPFVANMYLAEDRILCFEILAKKNKSYTLRFVKESAAVTDIPTTLLELTKQRRRWLNGAFFALLFYIFKFWKLLSRSSHSFGRRIALIIQFVYFLSLLFFNWFGVVLLYLSFVLIVTIAFRAIEDDQLRTVFKFAFHILYLCLSVTQILFGLGSKVQDVRKIYLVSSGAYGSLVVLALGLSLWHVAQGVSPALLVISLSGFGTFFIAALLYGRFFGMLSTFLQYLFLLPTFLNIFTVYSFCNLDDISWGTKEGSLQTALQVAKTKATQKDAKQYLTGDPELSEAQNEVQERIRKLEEAAQQATKQTKHAGKMGSTEVGNAAEERDPTISMLHAAEEAEEDEFMRKLERRKERLRREQEELKQAFSAFRTRILSFWAFSNFSVAGTVLAFDLIGEFGWFIAGAVVFQMSYRLIGTLWYRFEDPAKWLWHLLFSWWCVCITCPWERTRMLMRKRVRDSGRVPAQMVHHVGRVKGENLKKTQEEEEAGSGASKSDAKGDEEQSQESSDSEDDEEEQPYRRASLAGYAGYGIVQEKPSVDPTTGRVRRQSQILGWDQELDDDARKSITGKRTSIFDSGGPSREGRHSRFSLSLKAAPVQENQENTPGARQGETSYEEYDITDIPEGREANNESEYPKHPLPVAEKHIRNVPSGGYPSMFSTASCTSEDLEACLQEGEAVASSMARKLGGKQGSGDGVGQELPTYKSLSNAQLRNKLSGDMHPLWPTKQNRDGEAGKGERPAAFENSSAKFSSIDFSQFGNDHRIEEERGSSKSGSSKGESPSSTGDTDGDDTESSDESFRPRAQQRLHSFLRRRLSSSELSYDETDDEFLSLDYTPVTARRPSDIPTPLRPTRLSRNTEILMCLTFHANQSVANLKKSVNTVAENITRLQRAGVDWKHIVLNIIVDGRVDLPKEAKEYLRDTLKIYDEDMLLMVHRGNDVLAHVFERSTRIARHRATAEYHEPLQLLLTVKERPGGLLNSHLWFFGFCKQIKPKYCFVIDTGTYPGSYSVKALYEAMELDPQIGVASGEVKPYNARLYSLVQASSVFQNKLSHILQKPADSFSGLVTPFSGFYVMYRLIAIEGDPLDQYFRVEEEGLNNFTPYMANMYLTAERLVNFETVLKFHENWTSRYVADAEAEQEIPRRLVDLIASQRRFMSGSILNSIYYLQNVWRVWIECYHSFSRKFMLTIQVMMNILYILFIWFSPAFMYVIFFYIFKTSVAGLGFGTDIITFLFHAIYLSTTALQIIFSMSSRPEDIERIFFTSTLIYGVFMYVAFGLFILSSLRGSFTELFMYSLAVGLGCLILGAFLHGSFIIMLVTFLQYTFMLPTYVNLFMVYSFCNLHDVALRMQFTEGSIQLLAAQARTEMQENSKNIKMYTGKKRPSIILQEAETKLHQLQNANWFENDNPDRPPNELRKEEDNESVGPSSIVPNTSTNAVHANPQAILERAYQAAEMKRIEERVKEFQEKIKDENKRLQSIHASFRTRVLGIWLFTNWMLATLINGTDNMRLGATTLISIIVVVLVLRIIGSTLYKIDVVTRNLWTYLFAWWCCRCPWETRKVLSLKRFRRQVDTGHTPQMEIDTTDIDDAASDDSDRQYQGHTFFSFRGYPDVDIEDYPEEDDGDIEEGSASTTERSTQDMPTEGKVDVQVDTGDLSDLVDAEMPPTSPRRGSAPGWATAREDYGQDEDVDSESTYSGDSIGQLLEEAQEVVDHATETLDARQVSNDRY